MDDKYLLRHYGITLAERDAIVEIEERECPACGRALTDDVRIEVDHEHFKTTAVNISKKAWLATSEFRGRLLAECFGCTKVLAMKMCRQVALRASIRGVLCGGRHAGCNRRLGRVDKPVWLRRVADYLENPPARKVLDAVRR